MVSRRASWQVANVDDGAMNVPSSMGAGASGESCRELPGEAAPRRAVAVDDNPAFLRLLARELVRLGFEVVAQFEDGASAVQKLEGLGADLVLVDLEMPGMTGVELVRRIRSEPNPPRVVVVTSHGEEIYRSMCRDLGVDGFVTKIELLRELEPTLRRLF